MTFNFFDYRSHALHGYQLVQLTEEQHRILTSQPEGSTTVYQVRDHQQRVEGAEPYLSITNEERNALNSAADALQFAAGLEGINAGDRPARITDLLRPDDPPIVHAFAHELENWPELDRFPNDTFRER